MRYFIFVTAGFAAMLVAGNVQAQVQGGADTKPASEQPVISPKSGAKKKHEKMETRGNDVKLEASSRSARGTADKPKDKTKDKPQAPKRNEK